MKQELTIAVVLLATGSLLWATGSGTTSQPLHVNSASELASLPTPQSQSVVDDVRPFNQYAVAQVSYQQTIDTADAIALPTDETSSLEADPNLLLIAPPPQFSTTDGYLHPNSNRASVELLAKIAGEIADSQPFGLKLNLEASIFDQQVVASGEYYQRGQGSHQTKIELSFDEMPGKPNMLQLCDGRFIYTIHSTGNQAGDDTASASQSLEFVDLLRVKEAAGESTLSNRDRFSPTNWVATGGISSLLQHLASGFNFGPPESLDPNSDRISIRGGWDEAALKRIVSELDDKLNLGSPIQWDQVPKHIPHAIELVLGRTANQTYFPVQISFLRFEIKEHQAAFEPSLRLTFSAPESLNNLSDGFFVIDSSNLEPNDATDRYIARIKSFQAEQARVEQVASEQEPAIDTLTK